MSRWLHEQVPFPGATFVGAVEGLLRPNALLHGGLAVGGRTRELANIACPVLLVAEQDHVAPMAAALPPDVDDRFGGDVDVLVLDAGHVGLLAGRAAATRTVPAILEWLVDHATDGQ